MKPEATSVPESAYGWRRTLATSRHAGYGIRGFTPSTGVGRWNTSELPGLLGRIGEGPGKITGV